jgi:adenosylcobinamide-GDP ribazoletransferase
MKAFLTAIRFLTIVPVPGRGAGSGSALARSIPFFPFVGVLIGGTLAAASGLIHLLPVAPAAALLVLALAGASGALHLDGLADTADGFLSSRPRDRVLEIMRDSCSGAMGVIALVGIILVKYASLTAISADVWWRAVLLTPVAGRVALIVSMSLLSYARPGGGLGTAFYQKRHGFSLLVGLVVLASVGWWTFRLEGLTAAGVSLLVVLIFSGWCRRRIGGATGDTLGAACEIAEGACLVTLAASLG